MKKIALIPVLVGLTGFIHSQNQWSMDLNSVDPGDSPNFGTASNDPIIFFTKKTKRMTLGTDGVLNLDILAGTGNRFLQTDADGNISNWLGNVSDFTKILYGDGVWRESPVKVDGNILYTNTGTMLGIGISNPAVALDVVGKGNFSSDLRIGGLLNVSNNFVMDVIPATSTTPLTFRTSPNLSPGVDPPIRPVTNLKAPCNIWYKDPVQWNNGSPTMASWLPSTNNVYYDLLQLYESNHQNSVISMGIFNNDGIISVEPLPYSSYSSPKLKINPGCTSDVFICEGGGYTKMFNGAGVVGDLSVFTSGIASTQGVFNVGNSNGQTFIGKNIQANNAMLTVGQSSGTNLAVSLTNNTNTTNKDFFDVYGTGQTLIGTNLQTNNSMITVGQSVKDNPALVLTDNTTTANKDFFRVNGSAQTFIGTNLQPNRSMVTIGQSNKADPAFTLTDNTNITNKDYFTVYGNGYTEINVYSPLAMPVPSGASAPRVFAIKDMSLPNQPKDLFTVLSSGKVYAREVEISLQTIFPDYVFAKEYKLKPLSEVAEYITHNKHLPGFEKGEYYEKNGINVTELLVKQQEKIEELTLYIIDLEKREQKVVEIEKRLQALENTK